MNIARVMVLAGIVLVSGCTASGKPKTVLIEGLTTPEKSSIVHPVTVPRGLMMIRAVDEKSTYEWGSFGFLGSIYVPPGTHEFEVEISHDFGLQDAGGPAWTAPPGVNSAKMESIPSGSIFITKGVSRPKGALEAGKVYEVRFGFDRTDPNHPVPVTWLSQIPSI
ncbi:hypothetical protein E3Z27_00080 [Pseudomonas mediterranea]|jgi:hypothetical protein|uniref:hypothetical protein n=1 Tax=Pseudomonas mediterranea TaxID=183795 RepID=UPI00128F599C|nr:hypothetical protein [Pseudomonas mediterranea]MBL0843959.1 hypothetical protein [Pseudomonas mediterranea]QHA80187.1 hypothetical protein E3Z27_00080 [Pseudomonas mediterranea]